MIVITVQTYNGQPVAGISASFDELGGTIGRGESNQLVLADPDRTISRVHAQIVFRHGGWAIVDRGSNAVLVNGKPLGNGRESPLRDGDELAIGGYMLRVAVGQKTVAGDPFADLFGDRGGAAPAPAGAQRAAEQTVPAASAPPPAAAKSAPSLASAIPEDWDPFAAPAPAAAAGAGAPRLSDLPLAAPSSAESLDALFGLGADSADPFARSPLAAPLAQPNTATDADPLRAFGIAASAAPAPMADHVSDLNTPWTAPPLRESPAPLRESPAPLRESPALLRESAPPLGESAPPLAGAVLSWNQPSREGKVITLPDGRAYADSAAAGRMQAGSAPGALTQIIPRAGQASPATAGVCAGSGAASPRADAAPDALRAALAEGLGIAVDRLRPLDAPQLRLVGELLREATRGAVELLVARAALKREMRTDVTMIAAKENNPLKFSPGVEVALQHLMSEAQPGFMAPAAAMRDAFDDLRAHQLGVMAGMRSALEGVLQRFDPAQLETQIAARRSALASLLPAVRKAELWEAFRQLYGQLSAQAADDFHDLFGRAFRQAYEAHIDALQRSAR